MEPNATSDKRVSAELECFPPALRHPHEPLAGDLRKQGDGKERGFLKLLAGIAQLDFDTLYRRHERAQRKRRMIVSASALVVMVALGALTVFALNQREKAIENEQEAVAQREKAVASEREAVVQREKAVANEGEAVAQREKAEANFSEAERQRLLVEEEKARAVVALAGSYLEKASELQRKGVDNHSLAYRVGCF